MKKLLLLLTACALVSLAGLAAPDQAIASCSLTMTCPDGTTKSCSGTTCVQGSNYISCDGRRSFCPCTARIVCPYPYQPWILACYNPQGSCSTTRDAVKCGAMTYTCQMCESGQVACTRIQDP